jgi:hypothetical protein
MVRVGISVEGATEERFINFGIGTQGTARKSHSLYSDV